MAKLLGGWYQDYLNGNDNNISASMKNYISSQTGDTVCYYINKLVNNAKRPYHSEGRGTNNVIESKNATFNFPTFFGNIFDVNSFEPIMKLNVGIMFGGKSVEHDISIITGLQVYENLDKTKYNVVPLYLNHQNEI